MVLEPGALAAAKGGAEVGSTVKYAVVRDHLRARIRTLSPGDQLPIESILCEEYDVSRITIRRAVEELIRDGLIVRKQGRGTFVLEPRYAQRISETFADRVTGFYRQQADLGREVTTRVLSNTITREAVAAGALGLNSADELIRLQRLRFVNGTLHQHVVTFLPAARFATVVDQDFSAGSLFDFLATAYCVTLVRNELRIRLEDASGEVARSLQIDEGTPILVVDSTVFDDDGALAFGVASHTPSNSEIVIGIGNSVVHGRSAARE